MTTFEAAQKLGFMLAALARRPIRSTVDMPTEADVDEATQIILALVTPPAASVCGTCGGKGRVPHVYQQGCFGSLTGDAPCPSCASTEGRG